LATPAVGAVAEWTAQCYVSKTPSLLFMPLRTLYLHQGLGVNGHDGLSGHMLLEQLRTRSEDCLLGHRVLPEAVVSEIDARLARQMISEELLHEFDPSLIYVEGGLFADERAAWKIDWPVVEDVVDAGGVLIVADCGARELCRHRPQYEYAARFLRARAQFTLGGVVHGADNTRFWRHPTQILCQPSKMILSEWLRPIYEEVDEVVVGDPARLALWHGVAASGNADTTTVVEPRGDGQYSRSEPCIFASAARCGFGYVAFIAGNVSADQWAKRCPGNIPWLVNLAELLVEDAARNRARVKVDVRCPFTLFLSHRSVNKQLVARLARAVQVSGLDVLLDGGRQFPAQSLTQETRDALETMTHFVTFWSRACLGAAWVERELPAAAALVAGRGLPLLVVRLDDSPLPTSLADAFRIEAIGMSPQEIAECLIGAVQRVARDARR
jgi:hypothetical protein